MRRVYASYFVCYLAGVFLCSSIAWPQNSPTERETVIASLAVLYGKPINKQNSLFAVTPDYVLSSSFSDGVLVAISIEPRPNIDISLKRSIQLSKAEFDLILANVNSIKPLGQFEEEFGAKFVHGGRAHGTQRYRNAYLQTAEPIFDVPTRPVAVAHIYYLHPVTGTAKMSPTSNPEDAGSFGLVCVGGVPYIAPKEEFLKLWSNPSEQQTVQLAGPTPDQCDH